MNGLQINRKPVGFRGSREDILPAPKMEGKRKEWREENESKESIGNRCCKTTPEKNPLEKNAAILSNGAARLHLYDYKQLPSDVRDCNCV